MRKDLCLVFAGLCFVLYSCKSKPQPETAAMSSLDLKRGDIVSCGPPDGEKYGTVSFSASIPSELRKDFNTGIALLYSFEYDESEKMFAKIIDKDPGCAMAYWGVAMSNFHQLWAPPAPDELKKGMTAIEIARSIKDKTKRESDYIEAIGQFYTQADQLDHRTRVMKFEKAMEVVYKTYPDDSEAAVFYALALNAAADPADKTYANQRKAFALLNPIFQKEPLHPGIAHYIIHNCDYPELAELALPAARKYASIAPSSAHAQHMPSHIFTRLGLWDECIQSNIQAASSARCYAQQAKLKGHWDEELHSLDYLIYAYLQKNDDANAKQQLAYLKTINEVSPVNFKVAYAFAAIPARYALERKQWNEAADLQLPVANIPWEKFPWQKAIFHFARSLGYVHTNKIDSAQKELAIIRSLYNVLSKDKNKTLEAAQVAVQINAGDAWIQFKQGNKGKALELMHTAADMEDATEKHPVTPGAVIPARELLGEMLLEMNSPGLAYEAFEQDLKLHPNRRNGVDGLNKAAEKSGKKAYTKNR